MDSTTGRIIISLVLMFLYRTIIYIVSDIDRFRESISKSTSFKELIFAVDLKWVLFNVDRDRYKDRIDNYVRADAQVIDSRKSVYEFTDGRGDLHKTVTYTLTIKYYVGAQSMTAEIESDHYDKAFEVCYNVNDPHEVYLADDPDFSIKTMDPVTVGICTVVFGVLGYVGAAIFIFYPLLK